MTALQQWLDVLLDYDLTIMYRPGILHVIPDALSRMYMSSYADNVDIWGTHSNIRIIDNFSKQASASDFLCRDSLAAIKPPKASRKRHQVTPTLRSGGGETSNFNSSFTQSTSNSPFSKSTNACLLSFTHEDTSPCEFTQEDILEFCSASSFVPLFSLDGNTMHEHVSYATGVASAAAAYAAAAVVLTEEEKLLVAQEKRGKVIPETEVKKAELLEQAHAAGHFGEKFMYKYMEERGYWWPRMRNDIANTIRDCRECQKYTTANSGFHPAKSITASLPGDHFQIDLAELPESLEGHTFLLVVVDVFTGFVMLAPIVNKEAATIARALWQIFCMVGLPRILQSDNGSEFCNRIVNALCRLTGINRRFIAPYNPRADGKVERTVKTIKETIMKLLHGASALWPLYVPFVQLAYNNKVQELTGSAPFSLMFGRRLNDLIDYSDDAAVPVDLNEWKSHQEKVMSLIFPSISDRIKDRQAGMRKRLDALRKSIIQNDLLPGTIVMIKDPTYLLKPSVRPSSQPMWIGPYTIVRRTLYGPYIIRDDTGDTYPRQVTADQMKVVYSAHEVPKRNEAEGDPSYEVDYIIKHRETGEGTMEYYIKWKGYDLAESTWEPEENINDPQPVERYFKLLIAKNKAKKVSMNSLTSVVTDSFIIEFKSHSRRHN